MHTKPMSDDQGDFGEWKETKVLCPKCGGPVRVKAWYSECGSYTDYKYRCGSCNYIWWVDGGDS